MNTESYTRISNWTKPVILVIFTVSSERINLKRKNEKITTLYWYGTGLETRYISLSVYLV